MLLPVRSFRFLLPLVAMLAFAAPSAHATTASLASLDTSFGSGGTASLDWQSSGYDVANAITAQADGAVLVAGTDQASFDLTLLRYTDAGALDPTFGGGDGKATVTMPAFITPTALVVLPGGDIVVAVQRNDVSSASYLVRVTSTGTPVGSFGIGATGISPLAGSIAGTAMNQIDVSSLLLAPDGKLIVAGSALNSVTSHWDAYVRAVNPTTGAASGANYYEIASNDVSLTGATFNAAGDAIVGVGYKNASADSAMFSFAYPSLGSTVVVTTNFASGTGLDDRIETITRDGSSYLLGGTRETVAFSTSAFLAKVQFDGTTITRDASFGSSGVQTFDVNPGFLSVVTAIRTTTEGGLVATARGGNASGKWDLALIRTNAAGVADTRIGSGAGTGVSIIDNTFRNVGGISGPRYPFVLDARGRATIAGEYQTAGSEAEHRTWRAWATASDVAVTVTSLDATAPTAGAPAHFRVTVSNPGAEQATGVVVQLGSSAGASAVTGAASCVATSCTIGTIAAGGQATLDFTVATAATGALTGSASVTTSTADPVAANDSGSASVTVQAPTVTPPRTTKLTIKQYSSGRPRACGATLRLSCAYSRRFGLVLGGTVTPARAVASQCRVKTTVQRRVRGVWRNITVTKLTPVSCLASGAWRRPLAKATMPVGVLRVRATIAANSTSTAATSGWLYLRVS